MQVIRADEIVESGIIDRSMYALLYHADIVIADISTFNPNAIYELGIRHALRPYSTIIIKEDEGKIPFDIGHSRIISYKHLGNEISESEAKKCIRRLRTLIENIIKAPQTDSPLYSYLPQIQKPEISEEEISSIVGELKTNEDSIYALTELAKENMAKDDFANAEQLWEKLCEKAGNEKYYIQQQALCRYKSKTPSELKALTDALYIIKKIEAQSDTETLGIKGAICKRLWNITRDAAYLDEAIESYEKGWNLYEDYYTGGNYADCLYLKSQKETGDEKTYYNVAAKKVREEVIRIIQQSLTEAELEELKWKYATLANCYLASGDQVNALKYETLFLERSPEQWEIDTFENTKSIYNQSTEES